MLEYTIWCDECGDWIASSTKSVAAARKEGRKEKRLFAHDGKELCDQCWFVVEEVKKAKGKGDDNVSINR